MAIKKQVTTNDKPEPTVQVIKEAGVPTTSGRSNLGYQVGVDDSGEIQLRISSADGGGFYSGEWVSFTNIQAAFEAWPKNVPITSMTLRPLFQGKSVNTPGFLVAVLCAEGLLEPMPGRQRVHQACDHSSFLEEISKLKAGTGARSSASKKPSVKSRARTKATPQTSAKSAKSPRKTR